jgi:hypothetical protein
MDFEVSVSLEILEVLLDVIDMLLTHDASPTIEDNDGNNAFYFIQPTELPKYLKYFERCADFKVHCDLDMLKLIEQQPDNMC